MMSEEYKPDERAAFEAEYVMTGEGVSDVYDAMWSAFQKGAAWQRAQSAPVVPEEVEPDSICEEPDGCPTEMAVLKRFWREHKAGELSGPITEAIKWADHLLFECGALTHTRAPSVHVYNKTFAAVEAAKALLLPHWLRGGGQVK